MTASTGMARLQYVNAQTIHHWSGYCQGLLDVNTLIQRILTQGVYKDIKTNIESCHVLMIDKIGLISKKTFEAIELICR